MRMKSLINISVKNTVLSLVFVFVFASAHAQCFINAYGNGVPDTVEICLGDSVFLSANGGCPVPILCEGFNDSTSLSAWTFSHMPSFSNPCSPHSTDSSTYLWMDSNTVAPRFIETPLLDVSMGGFVDFEMRYAVQSGPSPCEGPDQYDEGVALQYALGVDTNWTTIAYFAPNGDILTSIPITTTPGASGQAPFTNWNTFSYPIPLQASTPSTRFRWAQLITTSSNYDHWGLDNVCIGTTPPLTQFWWSDSTTGNSPFYVSPLQSTNYTAYVSDGTDTISSSINIVVFQPLTPVLNGLNTDYCSNDSLSLLYGWPIGGYFSGSGVSGNTFNPSLASSGQVTVSYNYPVIGSSIGNIIVFEDDFSTDKGWTTNDTSIWQRASAAISSGCSGNQGPEFDASPSIDNFIAGTFIGNCYLNNMSSGNFFTSPVINCTGVSSVQLEFMRWVGCESNSYDKIAIQAYNGTQWEDIWQNGASQSDSSWTHLVYDVSNYAANNAQFQVRFSIGPTDGSVRYIGWNIDDVVIKGIGTIIDTLCIYTTSAITTVVETPTSTFSLSDTICANEITDVLYTGNASASAAYQWNFGNAQILSGTGQGPYQLVWDTPGLYNCSLSVSENNCTSSTQSQLFIEDCTGIFFDNTESNTLIYPNPNNGIFSFNLTTEAKITVYNALGALIYFDSCTKGVHSLNLSELADGMYFIKAEDNNSMKVLRVIINK